MADNPLADWLRERHEALGDAAGGGRAGDQAPAPGDGSGDGSGDGPGTWPEWTAPVPGPGPAETVRWEHPPDTGSGTAPRRRRLLLLVAIPWLVAGGLGAAALAGGAAVTEQPTPPADRGGPAAGVEGPEGTAVAAGEVDPALGAAAALAVRLSVTTSTDTDADGEERRYVDLAIPERLRWHGDVAVVTVAAVILEGPADRWRVARPARFAVPTALVDGQALAIGDPWVVHPPTDSAPAADGWQPAAADPPAVVDAGQAAGYTDIELLDVAARPDRPGLLRATIRGRAPGEQHPRTHRLWLRTRPEPAVLGTDH